jgi:hypothetical protein
MLGDFNTNYLNKKEFIGLSDHVPIFVTRKVNADNFKLSGSNNMISYRSKKLVDISSFCMDLNSISFDRPNEFDSPNGMLNFWHKHFLSVLDKHAPVRTKRVRVKRLPGWFNNPIREASQLRDKFLRETKQTNR